MNPTIQSKQFLVLFVFLLSLAGSYSLQGQGIKGTVIGADGDPLPFASIGVVGSSTGTAANVEGNYQLSLSPGSYKIRVLYLGYTQLDTTIRVGSGMTIFNPVMQLEAVALPEAIVSGDNEDPAYTIMRRAIAKAKYHAMQVDEYHAKVYLKGSGRLLSTPWLLRKKINKALAEEGIDSTVAFTSESVSKLHYIRPDQYRDTVISIRTIGSDNNTSPMDFVYSSFYEPKVVNGVSPLAPDAFSHYRFEYLGYIQDGEQVINKIKVTPHGKGDQVFEGVIYIVDQAWSIYSLDLTTYIWGIKFEMQQRFEALKPDVWLPVHEVYDVSGKIFGFAFEYRYFAQISDYDIKLNPDLQVPVLVLDAKKEKEEAKAAEKKFENQSFEEGLTGLNPNEELSTKQLRKMLRDYEKQEIEALPEVDTIEIGNTSSQYVDSTAYKQDSSYWAEVRPMPLTEYELKGYERQDSIAKIPPKEGEEDDDNTEDQDSVSLTFGEEGFSADVKRRSKFQLTHLISGGRYKLSDRSYLKLRGPLQSFNFNTVDGFNGGYEIELGNDGNKNLKWGFGPLVRYNISREDLDYEGKLRFYSNDWSVRLSGGNNTDQYSWSHPIPKFSNTTYSLLINRNYMKIFEKDFVKMEYEQGIGKGYGFALSGEYAERKHLENNSELVFIDDKKLLYTSNDPVHLEQSGTDLLPHKALISELTLWAKPFWEYKVNRGAKKKDYSQSPKIAFSYRKGWNEEYDPFDLISAQFEYKWPIGAGSLWSMNIAAGKFIGDFRPKYFADFAHFPGNRMIDSPLEPTDKFRMLDYYLHSTRDEYAYGLFNYQFRRFALTQINSLRRSGIRENIIFNALFTPTSQQYAEVGYAINYILRFLRVEFVTAWQDLEYKEFGIRLGVATDFKSLFGGF